MIATVASEELHVTVEVMSCVVPLVYVPVAVNCWATPSATVGFCGAIAIETKAAGFTVRVALALTEPEEMPMVVVPAVKVDASPAVAGSLLIVATVPTVELQ